MTTQNHISKTAQKVEKCVKFPHSNTGVIFTDESSVLPINTGNSENLKGGAEKFTEKTHQKNAQKFGSK